KLVVVFQPHTFSRTKKYQKDFEEILRDVDKAYVTPIYASAREANGDISSEDLVKNIPGSEVIDLDNIADLTRIRIQSLSLWVPAIFLSMKMLLKSCFN